MPYPTHLLENLKREYPDRWRQVASAMKNSGSPSYDKAVKTASKPGHGGVTASIAKNKKSKTVQRMLAKEK